jgi:hypothetical protein
MHYISRDALAKWLVYIGFTLIIGWLPTVSLSQVDNEFWFVVPELSHRGNTGGTPATLRIATMELDATVSTRS